MEVAEIRGDSENDGVGTGLAYFVNQKDEILDVGRDDAGVADMLAGERCQQVLDY